jgi:hypothetical protein
VRRHAHLVGLRHYSPVLVVATALLAGCGGGGAKTAAACRSLEQLPVRVDSRTAVTTLRVLIDKEQRALSTLDGGEFAGALSAAVGRARLALGSVMTDPLRSGTMSPTATVAPTTRRALAEARSLVERYC